MPKLKRGITALDDEEARLLEDCLSVRDWMQAYTVAYGFDRKSVSYLQTIWTHKVRFLAKVADRKLKSKSVVLSTQPKTIPIKNDSEELLIKLLNQLNYLVAIQLETLSLFRKLDKSEPGRGTPQTERPG